jgi:hypothetical protein
MLDNSFSENAPPTQDGTTQETATFSTGRNIGGFTADVTISEEHSDELQITDNPVMQGASVSDHAFMLPSRVIIKVGFSNSSTNAADSDQTGAGDYVSQEYQNFLTLQRSRTPFSAVTGKRRYPSLLIQAISVVTDDEFASSGVFTVTCREIAIVSTQTTAVGATDQQADPQATSAIADQGPVQATTPSATPAITSAAFGGGAGNTISTGVTGTTNKHGGGGGVGTNQSGG